MFPILAAATIAFRAGETAAIPSPVGHGRLTFSIPANYHATNRQAHMVVLQSGSALIQVTWTAKVATPTMLAAMKRSTDKMRSQGKVVGPVSVGAYQGVLLRLPVTPKGLSLHCALVSAPHLLSFSYFDSDVTSAKMPAAVSMFRRFVASARITGK